MTQTSPAIIIAEDDQIASVMLMWSGLDQIWDDNHLDYHYNFFKDVVEFVHSIEVDYDEFDADRPGASSVTYTLTIRNPEKTKAQLAARLAELIEEKKPRLVKG